MGQILSQPVTEKHTENNGDKHLAYGLSSMQGWRINMEDAHTTVLDLHKLKDVEEDEEPEGKGQTGASEKSTSVDPLANRVSFFGVYDGHGGEKTAIFTGETLHKLVKSTESFQKGDYINAMKEGFLNCDQAILRDYDMKDDDSGCAATSVIITPKQVVCANAGDSRTIMSINGFAKALSYDHKPSNEGEKARICSAGGYVDMGRVNGNLALSRGIGDFEFKKNLDLPAEEQIVTCYPDVIMHDLDFEQDEFVVLACDGIWDCLTSPQCMECIRRGIYERKALQTICEEIMELCCAPTSDGSGIGCDNMSIIIVALLDASKNETLDDWYEKIIKKIELAQSDKEESKLYGQISPPYNELYKEIYGEYYEIGQQSQNAPSKGNNSGYYSMFGGLPGLRNGPGFENNEEDDSESSNPQGEEEGNEGEPDSAANGAVSLQKLLASNAITNENGVIYLDTTSAQSLLAHFGMSGNEDGEYEDNDDVHDKHIEEEVEDTDSDSKSDDADTSNDTNAK
ncbi:Piso0_001493 [Millerozyma farinosa CBS 7064]|uniref:protein-serine/threonine phosphatase n=1 Tax=Pichia sorbitophila (strain ATCC MYA-4447 / BCRC 22081 / CBS 7064 / NBRC 10061 / NRRL Y-12695) TaxID=559304 RepID=G8YNB3_PICSO|nr:Piso0_001493 [Millerozyma farinosa CBS 7064]